jgi:hypothetical protein
MNNLNAPSVGSVDITSEVNEKRPYFVDFPQISVKLSPLFISVYAFHMCFDFIPSCERTSGLPISFFH